MEGVHKYVCALLPILKVREKSTDDCGKRQQSQIITFSVKLFVRKQLCKNFGYSYKSVSDTIYALLPENSLNFSDHFGIKT